MSYSELEEQDLLGVLARMPKDVRDLMQQRTLFLAGGFIRACIAGERPSDMDMLGPDKEKLSDVAKELAESRGGRVHRTENAFTVLSPPRTPVQFIHRWLYDEASDLIEEFDFTIAQAVIWFDLTEGKWRSLVSERFYADLAARRLVYTRPNRREDAGGSMLRVRKFLNRGYSIDVPNLGAVISRLASAVDQEKINDEQQAEVVITGLLREVDPLMVIDGVETAESEE